MVGVGCVITIGTDSGEKKREEMAGREPPELTIMCADHAPHTIRASAGAITVGRDLPAHIRIVDQRVSRTHLLIEPAGGAWTVTDAHSTNGTFLDGERIEGRVAVTDGLTVRIGHPDGIAVTFKLAPSDVSANKPPTLPQTRHGDQEIDTDEIDPRTAVAGAAVRARREELGFSRQDLEDDGVIGTVDLAAFERGAVWPGEGVRARIEKTLKWPVGTLDRVHSGGTIPDEPDETTEFITESVRIAVLVDSYELTLSAIKARAAALSVVASATFDDDAALLADLRRLEASVVDTIRGAKETSALVLVLSAVRRTYRQLVSRAASAPEAPLSVRLYAARREAELTPDETATAAGVDAQVVADAEADREISAVAVAALEAFLAELARR